MEKTKDKEAFSCDNIICIPFAFDNKSNTGVNVKGDAYTIYLKNACVALYSIKKHNTDCDVALITNISRAKIPQEFLRIFDQFDILIIEVPFNTFTFSNNYLWSLAFYKLCVLKYLSASEYSNVCYLDTDVYVQGNLDVIWSECKQNIMLYDINHGMQTNDYRVICDEAEKYFGKKKFITHYGGEFYASSRKNAMAFVDALEKVYKKMISENITTTKGDEFLISIAADNLRSQVKNAGAYIYRFWTAPGFRLISTCYEYNSVIILHLPNEKNRGMIKIYSRFVKKGVIPQNKTVWKICRLNYFSIMDRLKQQIKRRMKK